jgi:beta-lactam-binding protein with PASTA domain
MMEIFQNGKFSTGDPVYQIGTKNADGTYEIKVFDLMTRAQAEAKLKSMGVKPLIEKKATAKPKPKAKKVPDYEGLTKKELEAFMRNYGVELDRRKSKSMLLGEVAAFFKGDWAAA